MQIRAQDFIRSFGINWFVAMSGGLGVPLTVSSYFIDSSVGKAVLFLTGIVCAIFASYWVWRVERTARLNAEAKIKEIEEFYDGPAFFSLQEAFNTSGFQSQPVFLEKLRNLCGSQVVPAFGRKNGDQTYLESIPSHVWASYRLDFDWKGRAIPEKADDFLIGTMAARNLFEKAGRAYRDDPSIPDYWCDLKFGAKEILRIKSKQ